MISRRVSEAGMGRIGYVLVLLLVAVGTVAVLGLLDSVGRRKEESRSHVFRIVEIDETTVDPKQWGKNYPLQYDTYRRTVDVERTRHGGSEAFQKLDRDPMWRELFAGYAFGIDYREERGHAHMLSDQRDTERVTRVKQPGACLHCHASAIPAYRKVGIDHGAPGTLDAPLGSPDGRAQVLEGFTVVCAMRYEDATRLVEHPVTCLDCHAPDSMQLRVTRPAFLLGIDALARSDDPVPHLPSIERWRKGDRTKAFDANRMASRQELRTLVCAQCHVEYYFKGEGKLVVYPWHNGLKAEQIEAWYDDAEFSDWSHLTSRAPLLKAQHPEFELWSQGMHARSGVACADCHMPYIRHGAIKVSDHHVRSPLLNIHRACQTCHHYDEAELEGRAVAIQDRTQKLMLRAERAIVSLIDAVVTGAEEGVDEETLVEARALHRRAQWRLDFVAAENSMGFHASQEAARLLGEAIDMSRQGEIAVLNARVGMAQD